MSCSDNLLVTYQSLVRDHATRFEPELEQLRQLVEQRMQEIQQQEQALIAAQTEELNHITQALESDARCLLPTSEFRSFVQQLLSQQPARRWYSSQLTITVSEDPTTWLLHQLEYPLSLSEYQAIDDYFFTVPIWTAVRFNAWDFLSKIEHKEALFELFTKRNLPFTETMWTYGQALKYLATTRHVTWEDALAKLEEFWEEVDRAPSGLQYGNNEASKLFDIAKLVLVARTLEALPSRENNNFIKEVKNQLENDPALKKYFGSFNEDNGDKQRIDTLIIDTWKKAVKLQNELKYNEPPDWYYPLRESLGAAYYRQTNYDEAAKVFCEDLEIHNCDYENEKIHKMNGRSLFGLIESLKAQSKPVPEPLCLAFKEAWKNATVKLSLESKNNFDEEQDL